MDKNAIKKFAVWAREELIRRVSAKAAYYGITEKEIVDAGAESVNGNLLSDKEKRQRAALINKIKEKNYDYVIEEVAYTWFNRFCALRFMEVNSYLPTHVRVFTDEENKFQPQILAEAIHLELDGLDMEKVYSYKEKNDDEELYKYLLITQCNALNSILPAMFQKIDDYTELLFPDNLLREGSVIQEMIALIPEEDWKDAVQIIGWLYQYYNTEAKDKVFADLKKNIKVSKENIPVATQLFTPDWIVRYMVENSLGRLWTEGHGKPENADWKYYLEEAEQEPEVQAQLDEIRKEYKDIKPEDIRCIDPCMGSGHILCYMFDVLVQIYESYGYNTREAIESIVTNNIYGLDLDKRAYQLAYFAVMMKARQYDRRFFSRQIQPNIHHFQDLHFDADNYTDPALKTLVRVFADAEDYGSLLEVKGVDIPAAAKGVADFEGDIETYDSHDALIRMVKIAEMLSQKYDVVCTNPPYMGGSGMNTKLSEFVKKNYPDYKSDLFSVSFIRCITFAKPDGYLGFLSPYVWMFIQSYEKLRNLFYTTKTIETLIQFEYSAFEEATVPICTFVLKNKHINKKGIYLRLTEYRGGMEVQRQKTLEAISDHKCGYYYEANAENFSKIPGAPVAYWVSENFIRAFEGKTIADFGFAGIGMRTGDNVRFLRLWYEVSNCKIQINCTSADEQIEAHSKWIPYNKGGEFRRWYGNNEYVVNWYNNGEEIKENTRRVYPQLGDDLGWKISNEQYYFKKGITWSGITSSKCSYRVYEEGFIFDSGANGLFVYDADNRYYIAACLNNSITLFTMSVINPTINNGAGTVRKIPIIMDNNKKPLIDSMVKENISLSKTDWDSFETSWDFTEHPLVEYRCGMGYADEKLNYRIEDAFKCWQSNAQEQFNILKHNEEELNRIFIDIYGLQDELTPEVEDKDVTVRTADLQRDIRSFISYAVGCMFGRYSLDEKGLAYAGGEWNMGKYKSFIPDDDNIIPICDDEYFTDDITGRFVEFVKTVYGEDTLEENLRYIADALGGKGSPRDIIRSYFINDFYADHCKIYQKRPIYWLFDSGKKNGFKCLIYMHRYQPDTIARIRTDYVHEQQARYRTAIADVEQRIENAGSSERVKLTKQLQKLRDQDAELRTYEEKIHHLADQMISIDLDDGVKHNYEIFRDVLAKLK